MPSKHSPNQAYFQGRPPAREKHPGKPWKSISQCRQLRCIPYTGCSCAARLVGREDRVHLERSLFLIPGFLAMTIQQGPGSRGRLELYPCLDLPTAQRVETWRGSGRLRTQMALGRARKAQAQQQACQYKNRSARREARKPSQPLLV